MDKQFGDANEMVEEIEQFLARKILGGKAWNTRDIAEGVYELITENAVVLTKEEQERLLKIEKDFNTVHYCFVEKSRVEETRKETAEKFAECVKMAFYYEFDELIPSIMADKIDEICKEITEGKL